jgi:hypothetical protein
MVLNLAFYQLKLIKILLIKYLTTDQTLLLVEIYSTQIHQHKQTCRENNQPICRFQYSKPPIVDMGLGVDISFEKYLIYLNEENHIFANLRSIVRKPTLFLKHKVNDI